jgi:spermidine synthase
MGATFPLMLAYIGEQCETRDSFSFLYQANVLGAMSGTLLTVVAFVELFGLQGTLWVAAAGNLAVSLVGGILAWKNRQGASTRLSTRPTVPAIPATVGEPNRWTRWILFCTGFSAMGMEVVWVRLFAPVLKTQVYSFAAIVFAYLGATALGSLVYRKHLQRGVVYSSAQLTAFLAVAAFLPIIIGDPRWLLSSYTVDGHVSSRVGALTVLASLFPLCAALGYLTPGLIDEYSKGRPKEAGWAYSLNVLGCILGPLVASYVLLPLLSERHSLIALSLPFVGFCFLNLKSLLPVQRKFAIAGALVAAAWASFYATDFESQQRRLFPNGSVRRDYAASVISNGKGFERQLLVNGIGVTRLHPVTKFMVHLPAAFHTGRPKSALVICFGMGTTFRSALSWDMETTAVELVPSVTRAFEFYHPDAPALLSNPKGHVVIDDGRRFLNRTKETFDLIVIDPPPPPEAAGSSLLYSTEFYAAARRHLNPHGILQAWYPGGEVVTGQAVVRSLADSFPHVRAFVSVFELGGVHFLASMDPIEARTPDEFIAATPEQARKDLGEWYPAGDSFPYLSKVLASELAIETLLNPDDHLKITDDRPFNEYFLLRRWDDF